MSYYIEAAAVRVDARGELRSAISTTCAYCNNICIEHLYRQKLEVVLSAMEGEEGQLPEDQKENLICCDAAMIYYGNGNEPWFRTKVRDLDKAYGYGRQNNWLAKAVYLAPPKTDPKENLLSRETLVIRGYEDFQPESLEPFIAQLKRL